MGELLLAVTFSQQFIEQAMLQFICLDNLLWIKLDFPQQFLKAEVVLEPGLGLVDHPNVQFIRVVDHFLDLENEVAHALHLNDLIVYCTFLHVVDALHLEVEGGQVSRDLLYKVVVHAYLFINHGFTTHQPNYVMLRFCEESLLFEAFWAAVAE